MIDESLDIKYLGLKPMTCNYYRMVGAKTIKDVQQMIKGCKVQYKHIPSEYIHEAKWRIKELSK